MTADSPPFAAIRSARNWSLLCYKNLAKRKRYCFWKFPPTLYMLCIYGLVPLDTRCGRREQRSSGACSDL